MIAPSVSQMAVLVLPGLSELRALFVVLCIMILYRPPACDRQSGGCMAVATASRVSAISVYSCACEYV